MSSYASNLVTESDIAVTMAGLSQPDWAARSFGDRAAVLRAYADQLRGAKEELRRIISEETGKPLWESATEVEAMIGKVELSIRAQVERRGDGETIAGGVTAATRYKPHGVVAVLGPFNFPGHLPNGHIVPALLAGNAVVFKPSEFTPRTARKMEALFRAAGLPGPLMQIVEGDGDVGRKLVRNNSVAGIFFTGSFRVGRSIHVALAETPGKIAALEMGGNNPLVVWNVADADAAAYMIVQSAYLTAGQRCSCARRLIVSHDEAPKIIDSVLKMIARVRVGLFTDSPEPFMGPVIHETAAERLLAAQQALVERGAIPLARMESRRCILNLISPGLLDITDVRDNPLDDEEHFGPLLQVIRVPHFEAAIRRANRTSFGLAAGLLSDDRAVWETFYREIKAGVVNWNRPLTGASSALPFGGVGDSGNNRPSAFFAADYCSYPVASLESQRLAMPATLTPGIDL